MCTVTMIHALDMMQSGKLFMLLLSSADIFQNLLFQKILSGELSECQMD